MQTLQSFVLKKIGEADGSFKSIGGGYYADVYRFDFKDRESQIIKVYKSVGIMSKEISQIKILSQYALFPMPEALWTHRADDEFSSDILAMNCLEGENGGNIFYINRTKRERLAEQVTDNLITFHNVHNADGFGEINGDKYYKTFNDYYKEKTVDILNMAKKLNEKGQITDDVLSVVNEAFDNFDKIFRFPITQSSLIHGDYNMWNVMVSKKECKVTAIIDPCGCMWADREYDLFQLRNMWGDSYGLYEEYKRQNRLSEYADFKIAYYAAVHEASCRLQGGLIMPLWEELCNRRLRKEMKKIRKYFYKYRKNDNIATDFYNRINTVHDAGI